jgi:hypothetical protein
MQTVIYTLEVELPVASAHKISDVIAGANGYTPTVVAVRIKDQGLGKFRSIGIPIKANGAPYQRVPRLKNGRARGLKKDGTPDMRGGWKRPTTHSTILET